MNLIKAIWPMFSNLFGKPVSRTRKKGVRVVKRNTGTPPRKPTEDEQKKHVSEWEQIMRGRAAHALRQAQRHPTGYYGQAFASDGVQP